MSDAEKEWASGAITDALISLDVFKKCRKPFVFMSVDGEPDTEQIIGLLLAMEREVSVPRVRGGEMEAVRITPYTDFKRNRWGILEPFKGRGHGGGYYDKFLSRFPDCVKVGVAFSCRGASGIVTEPHDIPLDILVTEKEIFTAQNVAVSNEFGGEE